MYSVGKAPTESSIIIYVFQYYCELPQTNKAATKL